MRIVFCDLNHNLVDKVRELGIESYHDDYFRKSTEIDGAVMMTASNPHFSMGGGLDAKFMDYFPYYCQLKRMKVGSNERIGNICFTITVDNSFKATKDLVKEAIQFSIDHTYDGETLVLSGVGTGIGRNGAFSEDDLVNILKDVSLGQAG